MKITKEQLREIIKEEALRLRKLQTLKEEAEKIKAEIHKMEMEEDMEEGEMKMHKMEEKEEMTEISSMYNVADWWTIMSIAAPFLALISPTIYEKLKNWAKSMKGKQVTQKEVKAEIDRLKAEEQKAVQKEFEKMKNEM